MTERFDNALVFACRLHRGQARKVSGVAYISHLLAVAALAIEAGGDEDEAIAALLHDAVEDQGGAATREKNTRPLRRKSRRNCRRLLGHRPHAQAALEAAQSAPTSPASRTPALPCCWLYPPTSCTTPDRCSLRTAKPEKQSGSNSGADGRGTLWYYRAAADAIRAAGGTPLSAALERTVRRSGARRRLFGQALNRPLREAARSGTIKDACYGTVAGKMGLGGIYWD